MAFIDKVTEFFTSTTGIVASVIVGLLIISSILGIIHRYGEIRKQRRKLQSKETPETNIKLELDEKRKPGNLRMIGLDVTEFDWSEVKEIRFQLINDGQATVVIKSLKLLVPECGPSNKLKMIRPGAPLSVYHYRVELNQNDTEYAIIKSLFDEESPSFYYKEGEADSFVIKLVSNEAYWYKISFSVEWYEFNDPNNIKEIKSRDLHIEYCLVTQEDVMKLIDQSEGE